MFKSCSIFREATKMDHLQILDSLLKKDYDRRATPTNHLKIRKWRLYRSSVDVIVGGALKFSTNGRKWEELVGAASLRYAIPTKQIASSSL
ncbi:hypothetical protein LSTR_LSTR013065 [Laodelphax striatellus]|uniref:Uncharacterized protein n=1 Tax=Laodelphax striatellus TaxID=195883 RepID=A0A482WQ42_LAOST|nr:hypothetical protein LSTR_LSTR013065 [Laodelphax striatellus]